MAGLGAEPWSVVLRGADAVVTQYVTPPLLRAVGVARARLVIDAYVPMVLENWLQNAHATPGVRSARAATVSAVQTLSLLRADAVVCASEAQRGLWTGYLMALRRLSPAALSADPGLEAVAVVPFGLPDLAPTRSGPGPRETFGLPADAVVGLWFGGMWDWFDPCVVVRAMAAAYERAPGLHLVLAGHRLHGSDRALTTRGREATALAERLGVLGRTVHFSAGWVPYQERQSWLLDADFAVSAHDPSVEANYAFRTRVLDYLWAGLPCLLTAGDSLARTAVRCGFGRPSRPATWRRGPAHLWG